MRRQFIGGYSLVVILLVCYWVPIAWWAWRAFTGPGIALPHGLPFGHLVVRTVVLSFLASSLSVVAAYPFVLLWRLSPRVSRPMGLLVMAAPLLMGLLARNYSWIGLLSNQGAPGALARAILGGGFLYSSTGVVITMACIFTPLSFFILLQGVHTASMAHVESARTLGAPDWKILMFVVLPLTFRSAVLALGFTFAFAVGFFVTPRMIGGGKYEFVGNSILMYVDLGRFDIATAISLAFLAVMTIPGHWDRCLCIETSFLGHGAIAHARELRLASASLSLADGLSVASRSGCGGHHRIALAFLARVGDFGNRDCWSSRRLCNI